MPDTSLMLATTGDSSPPLPSKSAMRIAEGRNGLLFPVKPVSMGLFKRPAVGGVPSAMDVECAAAKVAMGGVIRGRRGHLERDCSVCSVGTTSMGIGFLGFK
jgi:hypothetical protein